MRDPGREFDKTCLRSAAYGYVVHRDYAAHFFRWGWVSRKFINPAVRVLDIGCGPDAALVKVLTHKLPSNLPKSYLGVDLNRLGKMPERSWATFIGGFDFTRRWVELDHWQFDLIVCLEVVEHMRMPAVRKLLRGARELMTDGGRMVLSTPVCDGHMAKNHVNEMTIAALQKELSNAGWTVLRRYGTFMSDRDRRRVATTAENAICDRLKEYYSTDVTACFLAPLYPDASRNNVWLCAKNIAEDLL